MLFKKSQRVILTVSYGICVGVKCVEILEDTVCNRYFNVG